MEIKNKSYDRLRYVSDIGKVAIIKFPSYKELIIKEKPLLDGEFLKSLFIQSLRR